MTTDIEQLSFDSISRTEELEKILGDLVDLWEMGELAEEGPSGAPILTPQADGLFTLAKRILSQDYSGDEFVEGGDAS